MSLRTIAVIVVAPLIPMTTHAQNVPMRERIATLRNSDATGRSAVVDPTDRVFPQIITGQGWETRMVLVNVGGTVVNFTEAFGDVNGNPMKVTFQNYPQGQIVSDVSIVGKIVPKGSFDFTLFDTGNPMQVGWGAAQL
jgi:hypothetical protein